MSSAYEAAVETVSPFRYVASSLGLEPRIKAPETLVLPITPRGNKREFLTPKSANDLFA